MSTFHPGITRGVAQKLLDALTGINGGSPPPPEIGEIILKNYETILNSHACQAAGIMGNDPSSIYRSIWYRSDGWNHGGSAMTWQDRCEELEAELATKNALIDHAKPLLEEYFSELDCSGESNSRAAHAITKLLTDIEHL